jgi:hypothetical protein
MVLTALGFRQRGSGMTLATAGRRISKCETLISAQRTFNLCVTSDGSRSFVFNEIGSKRLCTLCHFVLTSEVTEEPKSPWLKAAFAAVCFVGPKAYASTSTRFRLSSPELHLMSMPSPELRVQLSKSSGALKGPTLGRNIVPTDVNSYGRIFQLWQLRTRRCYRRG